MTKHAWEETLEEYLGYSGLMDNPKNLKGVERDGLKFVMSLNEDWKSGRFDERMAKQKHETFMIGDDKSYEMMFWGNMSWLIFKDDEIIGAAHSAFPYVSPNHRGRGIMSDIFVIGDEKGRHGKYVYSIGGFNARMEAHRKHVERALERGDAIPENVMQDYEYRETGLVRTKEYDFLSHKRTCDDFRWKATQKLYADFIEPYDCSFMDISIQEKTRHHQNRTGMEFLKKLRDTHNQGQFLIMCSRPKQNPEAFCDIDCFLMIDDMYYNIHGAIESDTARDVAAKKYYPGSKQDILIFNNFDDFSSFIDGQNYYMTGKVKKSDLNEALNNACDYITKIRNGDVTCQPL